MKCDWVPDGFEFRGEVRPSLDGEHVLNFDGTAGLWTGERSLSWNVILHKIEKPKQYRPFSNAAEFTPHRDRWWRYKESDDGDVFRPPCFFENESYDGSPWDWCFEHMVFDDGSPFGVEVVE